MTERKQDAEMNVVSRKPVARGPGNGGGKVMAEEEKGRNDSSG